MLNDGIMGKYRAIDLNQYSYIPCFQYSNLVDYEKSNDQTEDRWN